LILGFWLSLVLVIYFGIVVIIDLEHHLIMHPVSIFGAIIGIFIGIYLHGVLITLVGGLAGFGAMLGLYFLGALFARIVVRRSQEGFSDEALGFIRSNPWLACNNCGIIYFHLACWVDLSHLSGYNFLGKKVQGIYIYPLWTIYDSWCSSIDLFQ
jgi:prepilin signal peptidase PulO-like enzyme (type II secretory pathway)